MRKNGKGLLKLRMNRLSGITRQPIIRSGSNQSIYSDQPFIEEIDARQLYSVDNALAYVTQIDEASATNNQEVSVNNTVTPSIHSTTQVTSQTQQSHELVFIDRQVEDYDAIVSDLAAQQDKSRQLEIYFLDSQQDGIEQISQVLASLNDINAIHIISHGNEGEILLGNASLNNQTIGDYSQQLESWNNYLNEEADLLIYGCDVAGNEIGQSLLQQISALTQTDIAASTDLTGHASLNADWDLEYQVGDLESSTAISKNLQAQWQHTLAITSTTDFNVNSSNTTGNQEIASQGTGSQKAIDIDANGNYVVVWSSLNQDGDGWGVYAQRYNANGTAQGSEIHVNENFTTDNQRYASVAMDNNGNFVVTWTEYNDALTSSDIYARRFDNLGNPADIEFKVNTENSGLHSNASIDVDKVTGDFIIVWQASGALSATDSDGVYYRRFNANSTSIDAIDKLAHTDTGNTTAEHDPVVAMLTSGKFVVGWDEGDLIYHKRFNSSGSAIDGSKVSIDDGSLGKSTDLNVSSNASGSYIFSYRDLGLGKKIWIRGFDELGGPLLNTGGFNSEWTSTSNSTALNPSISLNDDGSFIVSYQNTGDGDGTGIFARKFDLNGNPTSSDFQINSVSSGNQVNAAIASTDNSNFVVAWSGEGIGDPGGISASQTGETPLYIEVDTIDDSENDGDTSSIAALLNDKGTDGKISLREAITAANNSGNGFYEDEIHFNLPGATTINLTSALPTISDALIIDGTSQPGFTDSPIVELNGTSAGGTSNGLVLGNGSDGSTIEGLVINRFQKHGISIDTSSNQTIIGNYIGTDAAGLLDLGNANNGIRILNGSNNQIGDVNNGEGNLISGNDLEGIEIFGSSSTNNIVYNNLVGTDNTGLNPIGNNESGIYVGGGANSNIIGGISTNQGNRIAFNGAGPAGTYPFTGVRIGGSNTDATTKQNTVRGNSIQSHPGLGINLGVDEVTANDPDDSDTGPNDLQNTPVLTGAIKTGTNLRVTGDLTSTVSTSFEIDFYASSTPDGTGYGEAERYLDSATLSTNSSGVLTIDETFAGVTISAGEYVTATATDINGNTSEFAQNVLTTSTNTPPTFTSLSSPIVTTLEDTEVEITYSNLSSSGNASDNVSVDGFVVKSVNNGTLRIGSNAGSAVLWSATSNDLIDNSGTRNAYWTPSDNTNGTISAFEVVAIDNEGSESSTNVTVEIDVTEVNDPPTIVNNAMTLNQGDTVTLNSSILSVSDPDTTDSNVTITFSGITHGNFAYSATPSAPTTVFSLDELLAGDIVFVHDDGELAPTYAVSASDGSLNQGPNDATINFTGTSEGVLWISVQGNEGTSNGIPGLDTFSLNEDDVFQHAGTNFALGDGTTNGEFSVAFNASQFSTTPDISGLHYVTRSVTIGATNPKTLQTGDLLLTIENATTFTSNGIAPPSPLGVDTGDIFYFRPDTAGDYSRGNFYRLLDDIFTDRTHIHGLSLVETDTWVGDHELKEGDFLISQSNPSFHSNVLVLKTNTLNTADNNSFPAPITLLYGSDTDLNFDRQVQGLDVLENNTTIGGQTYNAGTLLITFDNDDDIDSGVNLLTVSRNDIAVLSVNTTNITGAGKADITASILFDGSNVNIDSSNETIDALSVTSSVTPSSNVATPTMVNNTLSLSEDDTVTITSGMISATDTDSADNGLLFNVSTITGGQFELASNPGAAITSFTQSQILSSAIIFDDNGDETAPSFNINVTDGTNTSSTVAGGVSFTNINDDPTGSGSLSNVTLNDNAGPVNLFSGLTVSDPDSGENDLTLRIALSNPAAGIVSGTEFTDQGGGVYTASGLTVAQANTALSNATFTPTNNSGTSGTFLTNIGVAVNDQSGGGNQTIISPTALSITRINDNPDITSNGGGANDAFSVAENQTAVTTVAASDADLPNDALLYSISGGDDQLLFDIDSGSGVVTFKNAPNYESPADTGANNIYDIVVTVTDNEGSTDTQTLAVSVSDVYEDPATTITAVNDSESTIINSPVVIDVVANDIDSDGLPLTILDWSSPANGSITNNLDGTLTYTPDTGYSGIDTFNYAVTNTADSTEHYWGLGGNAQDAYDLNNGTVNGTTAIVGQYGGGLQFNETSDYVQIPDVTYSNEFTVSFAFKIDDNSGNAYKYVYSHGPVGNPDALNIYIGETTNTQDTGDRDIIKVVLQDNNDSSTNFSLDADISTLIGDGQWHTYTVTASSAQGTRAYLDGSLVNNDPARGTDILNPSGDVYFGARDDLNAGRFYGGGLDSLRIFSSALTDSQVAALATTPLSVEASVNVTVGNIAPIATNLTQTISYTEGDLAVALNDIVVSDPETGEIITASLTLADPGTGSLTTSGSASYDSGSGLWSIVDTVANVNNALANVEFRPSTNNDQNSSISVSIADGGENGSTPLTGSIALNVTAVNDAPTATNLNQTISYTEGDLSVALNDIIVSDVEGDTITATLTLANPTYGILSTSGLANYTAGTGIWTITDSITNVNTALAAISFIPTTENDQNTTITAHIEDASGTGPADGSISLNITAANDAPTATNLNQTISYTEGDTTVALSAIVVTDVDTGDTITATLNLDDPATGTLTTSGTATYSAGTWSITDSVANVNAALSSVSFIPATENDVNSIITTHIEDSSGSGPIDGVINLNVTAVNDAPTTTGISNIIVNEDAPPTLVDVSTAFADIEDGNSLTYSITGNDNAGLFSSVVTDSTARTITFNHASNANGVANITVRATDSSSAFVETTFSITVNAINDVATEITLSNSVLLNGTDTTGGYSVGLLATNDPDIGDIASFAITGGIDAGYFSIGGTNSNELIINADILDSKYQSSYNIIVESTDLSGAVYSQTIEITVTIDTLLDQLMMESDTSSGSDGQENSSTTDDSSDTKAENTTASEIKLELKDPNEPPAGGSHSSQPPAVEKEPEPETPAEEIASESQSPAEPNNESDDGSMAAMMAEESDDDDDTDTTIQAEIAENQNKEKSLDTTGQVQSANKDFLADTYSSGQRGLNAELEVLNSSIGHLENSVDINQFIKNMNDLRDESESQSLLEEKIIGSSTIVTGGLSVGYIIWLVRGGVLMSSVLSSLPAWRFIDPLPIIGATDFDGDEDDESLESIIESGSEKVKQDIADSQTTDSNLPNKTMDS